MVALAIKQRLQIGDAFAGLGQRVLGVGDLALQFGDARAQLFFLGLLRIGQFLFQVGLEFAAQADEFGNRQGRAVLYLGRLDLVDGFGGQLGGLVAFGKGGP
mgnify:CR=1 FL=1